jgi:hypothetical protein
MIKIALILAGSMIAFYFIVGRKIIKNIQTASDKKLKQEQQRAAWREGYQKEKIKIATEQGQKAARNEELQPTLDLRRIDSPNSEKKISKNEIKTKTQKKPICQEHNFEGKNWLDYARHIRKYHKIKK